LRENSNSPAPVSLFKGRDQGQCGPNEHGLQTVTDTVPPRAGISAETGKVAGKGVVRQDLGAKQASASQTPDNIQRRLVGHPSLVNPMPEQAEGPKTLEFKSPGNSSTGAFINAGGPPGLKT